jgi:hypothetical protein
MLSFPYEKPRSVSVYFFKPLEDEQQPEQPPPQAPVPSFLATLLNCRKKRLPTATAQMTMIDITTIFSHIFVLVYKVSLV